MPLGLGYETHDYYGQFRIINVNVTRSRNRILPTPTLTLFSISQSIFAILVQGILEEAATNLEP